MSEPKQAKKTQFLTKTGRLTRKRAQALKQNPVFWNTFESMISEGNGLRKVGNAMGIPHVTLLRWIDETPGMRDLYDRAREARAESLADYAQETVEAVRTGEIEPHAGRVVLDFAKWRTKADNPGVYSEKIDSRVTADINVQKGHLDALRDIIDITPKQPQNTVQDHGINQEEGQEALE